MRVYDVIKEYIWLVQTIYRKKRITLDELNELWRQTDMSGGVNLSRATFARHRIAIEDSFGIRIECEQSGKYRYYIDNAYTLEEDTVQNWILSTLSMNNVISEGLSVQDRIQIESIPDDRFLSDLIDAMKASRKVEIQYRRFGAESKTHVFAPYALKVYQKRWYVLAYFDARIDEEGKEHHARFTIFSFDRIESVKIIKEKFKIDPDFTVKDYFSDSYGIVASDGTEPEDIIIRAYGREVFQMRTLPLHHSQIELGKGERSVDGTDQVETYSDFHLKLKPTLDFVGKILSRGAWIEVIEPQHLRTQIAENLRQTFGRYEKK